MIQSLQAPYDHLLIDVEADVEEIRSETLAWAAGLFDGEGSTVYGSRSTQIQVSVAMTDLYTIRRLRRILGKGSITGPYRYHSQRKQVWRYLVSRLEDVQAVLLMLWPFLGPLKRLQALKAFTAYWSHPRKPRSATHCQRGHEWSPDNSIISVSDGRRRCLTCRRKRDREKWRLRHGQGLKYRVS